jgi:hypothetical protein
MKSLKKEAQQKENSPNFPINHSIINNYNLKSLSIHTIFDFYRTLRAIIAIK